MPKLRATGLLVGSLILQVAAIALDPHFANADPDDLRADPREVTAHDGDALEIDASDSDDNSGDFDPKLDPDIEVIRVTDRTPVHPATLASAFKTEIDLERYAGEQKRLEDLLSQAVGVQIRRFGGAGNRAEVSIRGSTAAQVVVLLDGVKLNSGRGGAVDLSGIPLSQLEAVEITRGGGAWGAGSGAIGGVVELRTRRPDYPSTVVSANGGSFGTYNASIARTQPSDFLDTGFGYNGFKTDGDFEFARVVTEFPGDVILPPSTESALRINNEHEQHNGFVNLGVDLDDAGYLLAQQSIGHSVRGEPGLDREAASEIAGQQRFAEQRVLQSVSQVRWEDMQFRGGDLTAEASLSHRLERSKFEDPDPALGANKIRDRFDDMSTVLSFRPDATLEWNASVHRLTGELRLVRDAFDPSEGSDHERFGTSVSLRDQIFLFGNVFSVAPGVRFDWTEDAGSHVLPSVGALLEPSAWLVIKANVGRSFRNPTFYDLHLPDRGFASGNPDLEPERSLDVDMGFDVMLPPFMGLRFARIGASVFYSKIKDSIIWLRVSPFKVRPENTDDATSRGVEVHASFDIGSYASVVANHTELRAESAPDSVRLPGRPERETQVRLELGIPELVKAVAEFQRTGSISVSTGGTYTLPSRNSWNASLAFELARLGRAVGVDMNLRRLWLHAALDNIADVALRDSLSFPQPGRSLRVGLEAQW